MIPSSQGCLSDQHKPHVPHHIDFTNQRDVHQFVWRSNTDHPLRDFRMTWLMFGVCASCFAANMAVKQNAIEYANDYSLAACVVDELIYVDNLLVGTVSINEAIELRPGAL